MRSFAFILSFLLLISNIILAPAEAEDIINKGILFRLKSVTINGESYKSCLHTKTIVPGGYIQLDYREYGRFLFSGEQFPNSEEVTGLYEDALEVHTFEIDLVLEMWEPILRDDYSGTLYFRHDPDYVQKYLPRHGCMSHSSSRSYSLFKD